MSRKNTLSYPIVIGQSLGSSFTTTPTVVSQFDNLSFQINCYSTDSTGTFALQVSDDYRVDGITGAVMNAGNWNPLSLGGGTPNVSATDAVINISLNQTSFIAIRVVYTSTIAGTGTCDIYFASKQIGG